MVFSYIDPGTGSLLGSAVVGLTLAFIFYVRGLSYRIIAVLTGKRNAFDGNFSDQLVFFSEGRNYWHVFQPICEELLARKQDFVYLTAGKDDPGLEWLAQHTAEDSASAQAIYLGKLNSAIYTMNHLKAKMCVMTTPQLDIMQLKRSPHVEHYCHVMHSPSDVHTYEKFAFDYFDSVLCTSQYVIDNLRYLEAKRQTDYMRKKGLLRTRQLLQTGCPYYQNYFVADTETQAEGTTATLSVPGDTGRPCVLLASSWGERSFLNQAERIVEQLLSLSFRVIFRPHPQAWTSNQKELEQLQKAYSQQIYFDRDVDNRPALSQADVLICDISGIIYDFAFIYQKPVLALYQNLVETMGYESSDVEAQDSAFELLQDVGAALPVDRVEELESILPQLLQKEVSRQIIDKHIFHLEDAGRVAAQQIVDICRG